MKKIFGTFACAIITLISVAQTNVVKVRVVDEQKLNLPGATILLDDNRVAGVSGTDGTTLLYNVKPGKHALRITYIGYKDFQTEFENENQPREIVARRIPVAVPRV